MLIAAAAAGSGVAQLKADEVAYQNCFKNSVRYINSNIIKRCETDREKILAANGQSDALEKEEKLCEATAGAHASDKAAAECLSLRTQPPLKP